MFSCSVDSPVLENDISNVEVENRTPCDINTGEVDYFGCGPNSGSSIGGNCCIYVSIRTPDGNGGMVPLPGGTTIRYFGSNNSVQIDDYVPDGNGVAELCFTFNGDPIQNLHWESDTAPFLNCVDIDLSSCGCN